MMIIYIYTYLYIYIYIHGVYPKYEWFIMDTPIKIHELRGNPFLGIPHILIIRIIHGNNNK